MILLVRVDDRLIHGQVLCAWVPFVNADSLVVASDEISGEKMKLAMKSVCAGHDLNVTVKKVDEIVADMAKGGFDDERAILVVSNLKDAMRLYDAGVSFDSLNIGNVHHGVNGRTIIASVVLNVEDDEILERFQDLGVEIDIRPHPERGVTPYTRRAS